MGFSDHAETIHDTLSDVFDREFVLGTYYPAPGIDGIPVRAFLNRDILNYPDGFASQINERQTVLELLRREVDDPQRNAVVTLDAATYRLADRISRDGYYTRWRVEQIEL